MASPLIAILSDFGTQDPFVGIMKGVIASLAPGMPVVDLTHEIPSGDIRRAAIHLWQSAPYFPAGTIFLAVVDPGVGTSRQAMVLEAKSGPSAKAQWFVGPDNGLFTFLMSGNFQAWALTNPAFRLAAPSQTFHGRDIFAPAAAHLSRGVPGPDFGPAISNPVRLAMPKLEFEPSRTLKGEILYADKFGNLLTSLGRFERMETGKVMLKPWIPGLHEAILEDQSLQLELPDGCMLPLVSTFADIIPGQCAALIGSSGLLEIASNRERAADLLKLQDGEILNLHCQSMGE
jgi:S-adenosylmethionine hydrolase